MADQNNVQVEQFVEAPNVQQLVEAQNSSGKKMLAQVTGIYTKCGYIEKRLELLQKRRVDQFRHLVQRISDFDDTLGGQYGFLTSIKNDIKVTEKEDSLSLRMHTWLRFQPDGYAFLRSQERLLQESKASV